MQRMKLGRPTFDPQSGAMTWPLRRAPEGPLWQSEAVLEALAAFAREYEMPVALIERDGLPPVLVAAYLTHPSLL
jgi:hypothetical protein